MTSETRLTEAQRALLEKLKAGGRFHVGRSLPAKALGRLGYVTTNDFGCTILTPAGRALLEGEG